MPRQALTVVLIALSLVGCGRSEPTPSPSPEPPQSVEGHLRVIAATVEYRATETDALSALEPGESVVAGPAANIVVGGTGHAELAWPAFLTNDLVSGADTLISLAEPAGRKVIIDQAAGTARYVVHGAGEPTDVAVQAGWIEVTVDAGEADFIVSFVPNPPSVWVVAIRGSAKVALAGDPDAEAVELEAGEGVAVEREGDIPEPLPVGAAAVESWFIRVAGGTADESIASVALVCRVTLGGALKAGPSADAADIDLVVATGDLVAVEQRDATSTWARISIAGQDDTGWIRASALECMGPIESATDRGADDDSTPEPSPTVPVATRAAPVVVATATRTLTPTPGPTATPTPTPTGAAAVIDFTADKTELQPGECVTLRWKVENIREVYFQGDPVTGEGSSRECPDETTTYRLRVIKRDGEEETKSIEVRVIQPAATQTPLPLATSTSEPPTATDSPPPTPTDEPAPPEDTPTPEP